MARYMRHTRLWFHLWPFPLSQLKHFQNPHRDHRPTRAFSAAATSLSPLKPVGWRYHAVLLSFVALQARATEISCSFTSNAAISRRSEGVKTFLR